MSEWGVSDWVTWFAAAGAFAAAVSAAIAAVVIPLVTALRENTEATNVSATNIEKGTAATKAQTQATDIATAVEVTTNPPADE